MIRKKIVGTLLPMTALVSKSAPEGTFKAGEKFVDWLSKSEQNAWRVLPLHQTELEKGSKTKHVPSPYKGYGVGLDPRFLSNEPLILDDKKLYEFVNENNYWLESYTLFCALRDYFGTDAWSEWPEKIRSRDEETMSKWTEKLSVQINNHLIEQAKLHFAYQKLQKRAVEKKISLIGDMPFYLGLNSPLVWRYQYLFDLDENGLPLRVSGVLVGIKSYFGRQIWGHPLYKWQDSTLLPELEKLFQIRLKYLASLFSLIRLDHAKGFFYYGAIHLSNQRLDKYLVGPGSKFLDKLIRFSKKEKLKIYAEDTGDMLIELRQYLRLHRLPGVKIFRFAYNDKRKIFSNQYLKIDKYPVNTVAYTTTHDTESLLGYLEKLTNLEIKTLMKKMNFIKCFSLTEFAEFIRNTVINSPAKIVLIPLQDWLLTTERINVPGSEKEIDDPNWQYRMSVAIEDLPTGKELFLSQF